jgi:hypothetical protein
MQAQLQFLEDEDLVMLIVNETNPLGGEPTGHRDRWVQTYANREQAGWDVERRGLVRWDVAQQMRATPLSQPELILESFITDPKRQLHSFTYLPMTPRQ